jgi:hypothetical protein
MPLKPSELGVLGIMLIIISAMFRLIAFMVKKSYEKKCQATIDCPLIMSSDKILLRVTEIHAMMVAFKESMKLQVEVASGNTDKISREAMEGYRNICKFIEEIIYKKSKEPVDGNSKNP